MVRALTTSGRPVLLLVQLAAALLLVKTPTPATSAYSVPETLGLTARASMNAPAGRPVLTAPQVEPPSVLWNMPLSVPASSVVGVSGSMARPLTEPLSPLPIGCQVLPPSVLWNRPKARTLTSSVVGVCGLTTRVVTFIPAGRPPLLAFQDVPPLVLLKTPVAVAA